LSTVTTESGTVSDTKQEKYPGLPVVVLYISLRKLLYLKQQNSRSWQAGNSRAR